MKTRTCVREAEIVDLVATEQWPSRADADLVAHAAACEACRDLALVASVTRELWSGDGRPVLPDASVVWYRAALQAREDAARRAARPMLVAHGLTLAALTGLAVTWWADGFAWFGSWWDALAGLRPAAPQPLALGTGVTQSPAWWVLGGALACWLVLLSLVFCATALADDDSSGPVLPRVKE